MARILVVDPEAPVRALTRRILVMDNHEVVDVTTAADALGAMALNRFDLVLTEVDLDDAPGTTLLDRIRETPAGEALPVIVTSARDDARTAVAEAQAGVLDHLTKPFGFGQLKAAVDRILSSAPEQLDELRVMRTEAAEAYKGAIDLETGTRSRRRWRTKA